MIEGENRSEEDLSEEQQDLLDQQSLEEEENEKKRIEGLSDLALGLEISNAINLVERLREEVKRRKRDKKK